MARLRLISLLGVPCAVAALATSAFAQPTTDGFLGEIVAQVRDALERASIDRAPKPPVPVPFKWRTKKRGSFDTGAPLLAMEAVDLDGVAGDELAMLTTKELIIFGTASKISVLARTALPDVPAVIRSRDPVGSISVERDASGPLLAVRTSEQAGGARYRLEGSTLTLVNELPEAAGFPLCAGISAMLAVGRNSFDPGSLKIAQGAWPAGLAKPEKAFYRLECRDVIGADGRLNRLVGISGIARAVRVGCQRAAASCPEKAFSTDEVEAAGVAFEVADLNRDGRAEVTTAFGRAPGTDDRIRVFGDAAKLLKSKKFDAGIIAITAVDRAGDGRRLLFFAVKQSSDKRINLWTLNRHP